MFSKIHSAHPYGVDAIIVTIECMIESQLPALVIVGLPDNAIRESKERVTTAIKNSGFAYPPKKITINMAPADFRKEGSAFDLPIAVGILSSLGEFNPEMLENVLFLGELSLDGQLRPIKGALPIAIEASAKKYRYLFLPKENASEASINSDCKIIPVTSLSEVIQIIKGETKPVAIEKKAHESDPLTIPDFADVKGQLLVKRSLEVAATGNHNIILIGPPGSGKTMLARRLPGILPPLTQAESLETTKIYSVAGKLKHNQGLLRQRPFRSPHHTISDIALVGGGRGIPAPGEVSLAHNGLLFLDELPEFKKSVLEVMRQPMEDKSVTIARAAASLTFPANFMLAAAMNPCPCGYATDPKRECTCSSLDIQRYLSKISGPLLDRIDIHIDVPPVEVAQLSADVKADSSATIQNRIIKARTVQNERFKRYKYIHSNAAMGSKEIKSFCKLSSEAEDILQKSIVQLGLSARAYDRIKKVGRTIADLDDSYEIKTKHIGEAIQYRSLDKQFGFRN